MLSGPAFGHFEALGSFQARVHGNANSVGVAEGT